MEEYSMKNSDCIWKWGGARKKLLKMSEIQWCCREEYPMENSNCIWQWSGARKKLLTMREIQANADKFSWVPKIVTRADGSSPNVVCKGKGKQCIDDSPLSRPCRTFEGNPLKSRAYFRDKCSPVRDSIAEVGTSENRNSAMFALLSVIQHHASSSGTSSDSMPDNLHGDSSPDGQFLRGPLGIADESSVGVESFCEKKQRSKLREGRRGQKSALEQDRSCFDEEMKGSSDWPCHPPASKRNQSLVSETGQSPFETESQKAKSEILFPELHLLADVAVRLLENDVAGFLENSLKE